VRGRTNGKITVSGTAKVTSANVTATSGTIYLASGGTDTVDRLIIEGGTVENTAANGNAVYNLSPGGVTISGGTVTAGAGGYAVYNSNTSTNVNATMLTLGGNPGPAITGILRLAAAGRLTAASGFTPGNKIYTLEFPSYAANGIAVVGGSGLLSNFTLNNQPAWGLKVSGSDLVVVPIYGISLSQTSAYTFPAASYGYSAQTAQSVTVTNDGTNATGQLNVALSGTNAANFTLNKTTINSIAASGTTTDTFTVAPNTGLAIGTYTATVTVSGTNITSRTFDVSFSVNPRVITFTIDDIEDQTHTGSAITPTLTVKDGSTTLTLTTHYTVSYTNNTAQGTATATVTGVGNYAGSSGTKTFTIAPAPIYSISLSRTSTYTFPTADPGYGQQTALTVTVTNTGNRATGQLTISLTGGGATAFTLNKTTINSIAASGTTTDTFTVTPNTGLAGGNYIATVRVSGTNITSRTFDIVFSVKSYGISLSQTGTYTFSDVIVGYSAAPAALQVNVTNTGNQGTGALTAALSGGNASDFTLSTTSISSVFGTMNNAFTVRPNTGLAIGTYTATVTVSGSNDITANFTVSFTVKGPYIITGAGTTYTVTKDGVTVGTANQPIQTVINAIRTHANGIDCTIQFGDGTTVLDIGNSGAIFNNTGGTWGAVTLTGSITSSSRTISIQDTVSVTISGGTVSTTGSNSSAVYNNSTGALTISGGTVSATNTSTGSTAVYNNSTGAVTISGGTVSARGGIAVDNYSTGVITVSGSTTKVTSENVNNNSEGTIVLRNNGGSTNLRLVITDNSTVENATTAGGTAIYSYTAASGTSDPIIDIAPGCTVQATGYEIYAYWLYRSILGSGTVNYTGATVIGRMR
jgi:uncharacterized membrane protein